MSKISCMLAMVPYKSSLYHRGTDVGPFIIPSRGTISQSKEVTKKGIPRMLHGDWDRRLHLEHDTQRTGHRLS